MTPEQRLRNALAKEGISRKETARRLDVSLSTIAMYHTENLTIRPVVALAIQAEFGISAEWILTGRGPEKAGARRQALPREALEIGAIYDRLLASGRAAARTIFAALRQYNVEGEPEDFSPRGARRRRSRKKIQRLQIFLGK